MLGEEMHSYVGFLEKGGVNGLSQLHQLCDCPLCFQTRSTHVSTMPVMILRDAIMSRTGLVYPVRLECKNYPVQKATAEVPLV